VDEGANIPHSAFRTPRAVDLLTVLAHELGHVLGYDDLDPQQGGDHVMSAALDAGVRRLPGERFEVRGLGSEGTVPWSVISHPWSVVGGQESGVADGWSALAEFSSAKLTSGVSQPSSRISRSAFHTPHSALEITDSVFARLGGRVTPLNDSSPAEQSREAKPREEDSADALDLWSVLYGLG
jgi:hypothetical protein